MVKKENMSQEKNKAVRLTSKLKRMPNFHSSRKKTDYCFGTMLKKSGFLPSF